MKPYDEVRTETFDIDELVFVVVLLGVILAAVFS